MNAERYLTEKDAEIERLKDALRQNADAQATFQVIVREQRALITELADALDRQHGPRFDSMWMAEDLELIQRAREAIK